MQRGTYVVALSSQAVEGGLIAHGERQPALSCSVLQPAAPGAAEEAPSARLEAFAGQAGWEQGMALLVLPTEQVSFRRLHFDFSDAKKIRQVLPFELENELLDGLEGYAYDTQIVPRPDGTAEVLVYLVDKAQVEDAAAVLEAHQIGVQRATFSAQALVQAQPPPAGHHFYLYVGSDESFIAYTVEGRIKALESLEPPPGRVLAELRALGPGSPHDLLQGLFRPGAEEGDDARAALRDKLQQRLEAVREEANRFVRINSGGEAFTVSLHGMFGELYDWHEGAGGVSLRFPSGAWPGARCEHFGVLEELLGHARHLPGRGLNFHRRVATWLAVTRELRWPLVAAGVLLAVLLGLGGTGVYLRAAALQDQLDTTSRDLRRTLGLTGPINSITVNSALSRLQERLDKLRKEREAVAFLDSYNYNTLKLFRDVSQVIKEQGGVTVDALSFNSERFTLSGTTPSYQESEALRSRIAALERFKGQTVKITNSNVGQVIRYRLTVEK